MTADENLTAKEIDKIIIGLRDKLKGGETPANKHVYDRVRKLIDIRADLQDKASKTGKYDPRYVLIKPMLDPKNAKMPTKRIIVANEDEAEKIGASLAHYLGGYESRTMADGRVEIGSLGYFHYIGA